MSLIYYKSGYKYQLHDNYEHEIDLGDTFIFKRFFKYDSIDKIMVMRTGYAWDGASGPTYDSKNSMRASLVHDVLYQMIREGFIDESYKELADDELYNICIEDGMNKFRAWLWYRAVKRFGSCALREPKQVIEAP